jgi:hypothetical protein
LNFIVDVFHKSYSKSNDTTSFIRSPFFYKSIKTATIFTT